ncbi:lysylphosphatidylglycerol synthase transmembrane domain-containing protein [Flavobacterium sp.]|uniref:lysylphosphatidylglycerol synthase transmembrane domain-containing protein n=1 Tax=Flavobacterium sp. TaxID=239 RepID=UPI0039E5EC91
MQENPQPEDLGTDELTQPTGNSFKSQASKWLSILLPILLGVYLIIYTYQSFTPEQIESIKGYFKNADYLYIVIAAIIAIFGNALRAYRWKYALEHMGYTSTFPNNFMAVNIGYLLNLTVPKSGEISRAVIVKKYNGIPFDKGFGSIVAERIVDMIILSLFMLLAFFLQFDIVKAFILDKIPVNKLVILAISGVFGFTALLLVYMYSKSPLILKLKKQVSGLKEGFFSLIHMKDKWKYFFQTVLIWGSYILTFYVTIFTLTETTHLSIDAVITSFVVGSIAIAFTNSGFGSYPFLITQILSFYAISKEVGTAFGWIVWTSQMLVVLVMGVLSFLLLPVFNRRK